MNTAPTPIPEPPPAWREADLRPIDLDAPSTLRGVAVWLAAAVLSVCAVAVQVLGDGTQALQRELQAAGLASTGSAPALRPAFALDMAGTPRAVVQALYPLLPDPPPSNGPTLPRPNPGTESLVEVGLPIPAPHLAPR